MLCLPVLLLTASIGWAANSLWLYEYGFDRYGVSQTTGLAEVELEKAASYLPKDIIIGNLEPAIIQTGTPDQVYEATRRVVEQGKKLPIGFIFAPGCELPPMVSLENVKAMNKAVEDYGWY